MFKLWFRMKWDKPTNGVFHWTPIYDGPVEPGLIMETMQVWRERNPAFVFCWERA